MRRALALTVAAAACANASPAVEKSRPPCKPPLHVAASRGDARAVSACLAQGADPNGFDQRGAPALLYAAQGGHLDAATKLIEAGARLDLASGDGTTALHGAVLAASPSEIHDYYAGSNFHDTRWVAKQDAPLVTLLIARGAPVNAADASGETALHRAVIRGALAAVYELLAAGADAKAHDKNGRTPLDLARERAAHPENFTPDVPDQRSQILRRIEAAAAPPECSADGDCVVVSSLPSCALPCGACPMAVARKNAPADREPGQTPDEMQRLCPGVLETTCSPCPAAPNMPPRCVRGRCR